MAVAAVMMVGCKNNGAKKAAEATEDAAEATATAIDEAIKAVEEAGEIDAKEAIEKLSAAEVAGLAKSAEEILKSNPDAALPFAVVENKPTFNGGDANDFAKWVNENIKYPQEAIDENIEGRVLLKFTVDKEGNVKDVKVVRGVNELLDNEAVRVVSSSPAWGAGSQNGTPVAVNYTFPVSFRLN